MHIYRTKFKGEILTEFLPPKKPSNEVIVLAGGMPATPMRDELLEFLSHKNYWVFFPRYRGSFESDGEFLKQSPHLDILDVVEEVSKEFKELWNGQKFKVDAKKIIVIGGSFGGPAAIFAARDPRVYKAIALSPIADWRVPAPEEPMDKLGKFLEVAYPHVYRFDKTDWQLLSEGKFYNPIDEAETIPGEKLLIIHEKSDGVCPFPPVQEFAKKTNAKLVALKGKEHHGISSVMLPEFWKRIRSFISK